MMKSSSGGTYKRATTGTSVHSTPKAKDALRAAQLYYLQDMKMEVIAKELGTSRSTVSRLLTHAKRTGMVSISISPSANMSALLGNQLSEHYGISFNVVPTDGNMDDSELLARVSAHAAYLLGGMVSSSMTVGVAWGSTMQSVSTALGSHPTHDTKIVQLNGAANPVTSGVRYASDILTRFGQAFTARTEQFPVPAFFDRASTRDAMWKETSIRRVLQVQKEMSLAVFSLGSAGSAVASQVYRGGYLTKAETQELNEIGVVGDVATVFFDKDGNSSNISLNARSTGPNLDALRKVPTRFCVVAGRGKLQAVRGALKGGLITDLVIDEGTALALLDG
ncbi:transcriptional regulator [Arthrobacter sp. MYb214]|uniref:sugar-binding transcriptional regulator n=1 Tax=Micrococcaceae TaxID=1268 RepID=UPI000CFAB5DA|nr:MULTISPECIES: sugar-binding domain-containing protein [unclassified Arthrobacter]PQZ86045.1 transcriptional regulator [Arthrobacter sp. MYb222]PRB78197.1 transcriptional regulator [Arthrobacter sp. MYb214]